MFLSNKSNFSRIYTTKHKNTYTTKAINDNRTIFQVENAFVDVTLTDVEDILESYSKEKLYNRNDMVEHCYSNGIDYDRVVKYYNTVKNLNYSWKMSKPRTLSQNIKDFLTVFIVSFHIMYNITINIALNNNKKVELDKVK